MASSNGANGTHDEGDIPVDRFDYMCFHAPTCKLVTKSYARLLFNDYRNNSTSLAFKDVPQELSTMSQEESLTSKDVEKTFGALAKKRFAQRVQPSIEVSAMCGNMYCASVYSGLCSLLANVSSEQLQGKRVGIFSYGSGLASSLFSFRVNGSTAELAKNLDIHNRLESRRVVAPEVYDQVTTPVDILEPSES